MKQELLWFSLAPNPRRIQNEIRTLLPEGDGGLCQKRVHKKKRCAQAAFSTAAVGAAAAFTAEAGGEDGGLPPGAVEPGDTAAATDASRTTEFRNGRA